MRRTALRLGQAIGAALVLGLTTLIVAPPAPGLATRAANGMSELPGSDADPWTVLLLSDLQDGFHYLPALLREGARLEPSAILFLGDLAREHDRAHLDLVVRELEHHAAPAPVFAVPGNHDVSGHEGRAAFAERFGGTTFSFRIGKTRFIGVDDADGAVEDPARLASELEGAERRGERVIVAMHRGRGLAGTTKPGLDAADPALRALLRKHGTELVLSGHAHAPLYSVHDGTGFVVAPASGDRGRSSQQAAASFLALHWTGSRFEFEQYTVPRRNRTELESVFLHVSLGHVRPLVAGHPRVMGGLAAVLAMCVAAGLITDASRRRSPIRTTPAAPGRTP